MTRRGITREERDAAARMADAVNLHVEAMTAADRDVPGFVAICLEDGRSPDNALYDSRRDLFRHHPSQDNIMAVKVGRDSMTLREAVAVLQLNRMAYKRGVIFREVEVITPHREELLRPLLPRTMDGLRRSSSGLFLPPTPFHKRG